MTNNNLEISKIIVPDKDAANRLKQALIQSADSASTRRNRQHFWKKFKEWCETHDLNPLPTKPDAVAMYLLDQAGQGMKKSTLNNMRWAIDTTHQQHGFTVPTDDPKAKRQIKGLFRTMAEQRPEQVTQSKKKPITINQIRIMDFPKGVLGLRDKALLLLGFATGMRRSELAAVRKEHIEVTEYGLRIRIPRSKSDQLGDGDSVDVIRAAMGRNQKHCPVKTVQELMGENPYEHLFVRVRRVNTSGGYRKSKMLSEPNRFIDRPLDGNGVYRIVKKYGAQVGLAPEDLGGHSLRAGCATYLLEKEVPPAAVQKQMRHKSFNTTQQYNRGETARALVGAY
jgi:integrase